VTGVENSVAASLALNIPTYNIGLWHVHKIRNVFWCCPEIRPNSCWFFVFISTYLYNIFYNHLFRIHEKKYVKSLMKEAFNFQLHSRWDKTIGWYDDLRLFIFYTIDIPRRSPYIILFIRQQTFVLPVCPIIRFILFLISSALNLVISFILLYVS